MVEQRLVFSLSQAERDFLVQYARQSILNRFAVDAGRSAKDMQIPPSDMLQQELGAFVTLKKNGSLRGCIGYIAGDGPLCRTVARMAQAAAFEDPRFPSLDIGELDALDIEISVMGPITPCENPDLIEVGRHGLIIRRGMHSGLLLPQVPVEWGWDRETFLDQTCRKAGLAEGAWRDPRTLILWFEASVFGSHDTVANKLQGSIE